MRAIDRKSKTKHVGEIAAFAAVLLLAVTGCVKEQPIMTKTIDFNSMTLTEQRDWVAEKFDAGVTASEVEGWFDLHWHDVFWPADRETLMPGLFPRYCGGSGGRLQVSLLNPTADDPLGATARVRSYWEAQGEAARDLYDSHHDTEPYFIVDFEDGGTFSMQADELGMSMSVKTPCSLHNTVTNWQEYLDETGALQADEAGQTDSGANDAGDTKITEDSELGTP